MLSLKKLLEIQPDQQFALSATEMLYEVSHRLLDAMQLYGVTLDIPEAQEFRRERGELTAGIEHDGDSPIILAKTSSVSRSFQKYNCRMTEMIHEREGEYNAMLTMLTKAVATLAHGCDQSVTDLSGIEKSMEHLAAIEDIRDVRSQLRQCLEKLKEERCKQQERSKNTINCLNHIEQSVLHGRPAKLDVDGSTGLPGPKSAEHALTEALTADGIWYAVLCVVDRVQLVNLKFGYTIGNELLRTFAQQLSERQMANDRLFRWNGPAILALIERDIPLPSIRAEIQRAMPSKYEKTFQVGTRSVLIPVSATWMVMSLSQEEDAAETIAKLNAFVTRRAPAPSTG